MSIQCGDKIPHVTLKYFGAGGLEDVNTADLFTKDKKIVMIGVPGAFTPTCDQQHLPEYVRNIAEIKEEGVDEVVCLAVNDPFVISHWENTTGAKGKITFLPDGNAEFTKALGLDFDGSGFGLGTRCKRFMMIVEDGIVRALDIEDNPGELSVSAAGVCLSKLQA